MKNVLILTMFLVLLIFTKQKAALAFGANPIELQFNTPKEKFGKNLEYFYDPSGGLTLNNVLDPQFNNQWKKATEERPNWGFRNGKLWLRAQVKTPEEESEDWVLDLGFHYFMTANFYLKNSNDEWTISKAGKSEPFITRNLAYRNPAFIIHPSPQPQEFVLELQSPAVLKIPGRFLPLRLFATESSQFVFALYMGIVLALAIFHFGLGIIARERVYIIYALYAATTLMTICDIEGYSYLFLWTNSPWWFVRSATVMSCLSGIFGLLFVHEYIRPGKIFKRLIFGMISLQAIFMAIVLVKVNANVLKVSHFTLGAAVILTVVVAATEFTRKNLSARIFLSAFSLFGVGLLVFNLQNMNVIASTVLTQHGIGIGQATEILLLSIALSVRINEIKKRSLEKDFQNLRLADRVESAKWFAHESRRPYQGILLEINNLLLKVPEGPLQRSLSDVRDQSKRSLARLNSLARNLVFGSSDSLKIERVSLIDMIRNATDELSESHEGCLVNCSVTVNPGIIVFVDRGQMTRVFVNLIANALEGSHQGTMIEVRALFTELSQNLVRFSVKNVGLGIRSEDLDHIFDFGFSVKKARGMGLGLSMVQKIISRHGANITVKSEEILESNNEGNELKKSLFETVFTFEMKATSEARLEEISAIENQVFDFSKQVARDVEEILTHPTDIKLKILLIDDDAQYLNHIESLCKVAFVNSDIKTETNPLDGLICAQQFHPNLVILDVEFEGNDHDGFWVLEKIKDSVPNCRVVLHSGSAQWNLGPRARIEGAFDFIQKPMEIELLAKCAQGIKVDDSTDLVKNLALPVLCVVDDELDLARPLLSGVVDAEVKYFSTPDEFLDFRTRDPAAWKQIKMVLSDYYFDGFNVSEIKLVRAIRKAGYSGPIILFSNVPKIGEVGADFTGQLDKQSVPSLKWLLEKWAPPS